MGRLYSKELWAFLNLFLIWLLSSLEMPAQMTSSTFTTGRRSGARNGSGNSRQNKSSTSSCKVVNVGTKQRSSPNQSTRCKTSSTPDRFLEACHTFSYQMTTIQVQISSSSDSE